jgi:hypothetical protein
MEDERFLPPSNLERYFIFGLTGTENQKGNKQAKGRV